MAAISSADLEDHLAKALEDYSRWWQPVDKELYDLCQRKPEQRDESLVFSKVAIIGRVYAAQVNRSFKAAGGGNKEVTVARGLVEQADLIEKGLLALDGRKFDRQTAREIVELHGRITRKLAERTGDAWLSSFVSKYLHFHCPIVPIYDSQATGSIGRFVDWTAVRDLRTSMATIPDWARAYRNFVAAFVLSYERVWTETSLRPTVKQVDHLLWTASQ
jgi:hypothetical protein